MATFVQLEVEDEYAPALVAALEYRGFKAQAADTLISRGDILVRKPLLARTGRFVEDVEVAVTSWLIDSGLPAVRLSCGGKERVVRQPELFSPSATAAAGT